MNKMGLKSFMSCWIRDNVFWLGPPAPEVRHFKKEGERCHELRLCAPRGEGDGASIAVADQVFEQAKLREPVFQL